MCINKLQIEQVAEHAGMTEKSSKDPDKISFGTYKGQNIIWRILKTENGTALIISDKSLETRPYHGTQTDITWEQCDLRQWLNGEFLNTAFTGGERERIISSRVVNRNNPKYITPGGNDTADKVFLLSIDEAETYFANDEDRKCMAAEHAKEQGAYTGSGGYCFWWLRSPGCAEYYAAYVHSSGSIYEFGYCVYDPINAVRPALRIRL